MAVPARHLLSQGRVLAALGGTVAEAASRRLGLSSPHPVAIPGPAVTATLPAPPPRLVRDFVRHVGGDPSAWRKELPPHLFPQWAVPLAARTLRGLPYPMLKVVNGGCRLVVNGPLPATGPLEVSARLDGIDDDGRRAVLHQTVTTGTRERPNALVADLYVVVPSVNAAEAGGAKRAKVAAGQAKQVNKDRARVPEGARPVADWRLGADAGLRFAFLTGDINPLHWASPYARAAGFRGAILHGFSTMARAYEGLIRGVFAGSVHRLGAIDVRFTRPLVLPARVGLYVLDQNFYVGDAPGGPAYLTGSFEEPSP
jgi:acyl dehydratase